MLPLPLLPPVRPRRARRLARTAFLSATFCVAGFTSLLSAATVQNPPAPAIPASQPEGPFIGPLPPEGPLTITVVEFAGKVQFRPDSESPWAEPAIGQELTEGAEFRTGIKSFVKVQIDSDQIVTLDRLGVTKINKASFVDGTFQSDVGVKYGRLKYEIEAAGRVHDATVRSATSTLAVRGTVFEIYDQPPFTPQAISYTGAVIVRDARKQIRIGSRGSRKVQVDGDKRTAAETALATASFDPIIDGARTEAEQRLIEQVIGNGGVISFDTPGGIPVVRGGLPLQFDETNTFNLPGAGINFVLNWTGDADLNLTVALPKFGDITAPVTNVNRGSTGGITAFDHRGGPNGGFEIVFFPANYPGSQATNPPGGLFTIPGPIVNGRPTVIIPQGTGFEDNFQQGAETYVTSINVVTGNPVDFSLKTFVRDPATGQAVFVSEQFGPLTGDVPNTNTEVAAGRVQFVLYNVPPALPAPSTSSRVRTATDQSLAARFATFAAEYQQRPLIKRAR
ncbi:MAG TPA: hypothetical protein PLD59_04205 [Tepidisphaeraceae bacterium]|nr:hypothetical protein [Tepidisphaeraceae bacterium]